MLHLTFAPNAHGLLTPFGERLRALWSHPFRSPTVIIPNAFTGQWLRIKIAEMFSCCMALRMSTLENILWQSLNPDPAHQFLHKEGLQEVITALLDEDLLGTSCFAPVKQYCTRSSGGIDPVRRIALSAEIARLFIEYEYNRPSVWDTHKGGAGFWRVKGVDKTWIDDDGWYFAAQAEGVLRSRIEQHEAWQKALYRIVFGRNGLCGIHPQEAPNKENRYLTLPQLYMLRKNGSFCYSQLRSPLVLFLTGKVSHFHRNMLLEISEQQEVYLFLVNPCSEFWEDVATSRSGRSRKKWTTSNSNSLLPIKKLTSDEYGEESFSGMHDTSENQLLELWGASGKENVALWCQAAVYNFEYIVPDQQEQHHPTMLSNVQNLILNREVIPCGLGEKPDFSLSIAAAPDRYREIEALRGNILSLLKNNPDYMLDDIIVYIPDMTRYLPAIERVFAAYGYNESGYIPFTYASSTRKTNDIERALVDFLLICDNSVTPATVFSFLRNEPVLLRIGVSRGELSMWELLAEKTGFCRGVDASHRKAMGDEAASVSDEHTFLFSKARVLLCGLAVQPVGLDLQGGGAEVFIAPYSSVDGIEEDVLERYCSTIGRLLEDCLQLRTFADTGSISGLCEQFKKIILEWIEPVNGSDSQYLEKALESLHLLSWQETVAGRKQISFEEFRHTVLSRLTRADSGNIRLTGALTFAPLEEGYILPCKAVFVAGMDAASFPGVHFDTPFNLLTKKRIIGDMHKVRDNRYLFLELLCSTGCSLHISYQALDTKNDRRLPPSSIVQELAGCIGLNVPGLIGDETASLIPVAGYEGEAIGEWNSLYARIRAVEQSLPYAKRKPDCHIVKKVSPDKQTHSDEMQIRQIDITDIAVFLRNPLEYRLTKKLRLHNEQIDTAILTLDEPLTLDTRTLVQVKHQLHDIIVGSVFCTELNNHESRHDDILKSLQEMYGAVASTGSTPEGLFADIERLQLVSWVNNCYAELKAIADHNPGYRVVAARSYLSPDQGKLLGSGSVMLDGNEIDLLPVKNLVAVSLTGKDTLIFRVGNKTKDLYPYRYTDLWLTALLLWQSGSEKVSVCITDTKKGEVTDWELARPAPWTKENLDRWFFEVISSMLVNKEAVHAPAVYFGDTVKNIPEFNDAFIASVMTAAEEDLKQHTAAERRYKTFADIIGIVEPVVTHNTDELYKIYVRLLPLIGGKFENAD